MTAETWEQGDDLQKGVVRYEAFPGKGNSSTEVNLQGCLQNTGKCIKIFQEPGQ